MELDPIIDRDTIRAAALRIAADVHQTPLWRLRGAAFGIDCAEVWLKFPVE